MGQVSPINKYYAINFSYEADVGEAYRMFPFFSYLHFLEDETINA